MMSTKALPRAILGMALLGAALTTVTGYAPSVHAAPPPKITVQVTHYNSVLYVTGSGFGSGDRIRVRAIDRQTHKVVTSTLTTASLPHLVCTGNAPCREIPGGDIAVNLPPVYVHCGYDYVSIVAADPHTSARSNVRHATLGEGPC